MILTSLTLTVSGAAVMFASPDIVAAQGSGPLKQAPPESAEFETPVPRPRRPTFGPQVIPQEPVPPREPSLVGAPAPGSPAARVIPRLLATLSHRDLGDNSADLHKLAFSPDGKTLAVGYGDCSNWTSEKHPGQVLLWDVATRRRRETLRGRPCMAIALAFRPDGKALAAGGGRETVAFWDLATRTLRAEVGRRGEGDNDRQVRSVTFSPDGRTLAELTEGGAARLWDVATTRERDPLRLPDEFFTVEAATFDAAGHVRLLLHRPYWKVDSRRHEQLRAQGHIISREEVAESQKTRDLDDLMLWDATADKAIWSRLSEYTGNYGVFSPDGRRLLRANCWARSHVSLLMDARTGRELLIFPDRDHYFHDATFSLDGRRLFTCGSIEDPEHPKHVLGRVTAWDPATGRELASFVADDLASGSIRHLALSPDGRTLATVGDDMMVRLWDVTAISGVTP